ncbi:hypothetical protein BDY19DRAFT_917654 [Irpex rosettiformis]|uniref:Uncharacterized protein n=1 Tax=Irpex rosettiformis TaxID=378272 RepID=A0ACB8UHB3_9APHY|nr:hypothetical protein BDY19DRAFT_917654 [Irpex rosettiformis]
MTMLFRKLTFNRTLYNSLTFSRARQISLKADGYPRNFIFHPAFFSEQEQRLLLSSSLARLDKNESRQYRVRRKDFLAKRTTEPSRVQNVFLPDDCYCFEEGHFDGVIKRYREIEVSSWPDESLEFLHILDRLKSLHPPQPTLTHILHLASDGEIFPHVDNVDASGSWILGVSLGNTRILRLENVNNPADTYELALPSGSVYLQSDSLRYEYKHSILLGKDDAGQRLSIMMRDRLPENRGLLL